LVSQSTAALLPDAGLEKIGEAEIKGLSAPVGIHTLARPRDRATDGRPTA